MNEYKITILHLYPDLLNLYGDKGNIECLRKRLEWRDINTEVIYATLESDDIDIKNADIIFLGGGSDRETKIVLDKLLPKKEELKGFVENGGTFVAVCGGFQMLGKHFFIGEEKVSGLEILDIETNFDKKATKCLGNAVVNNNDIPMNIVGFENHAEITNIFSYEPLGRVLQGFGNDGKGEKEGVVYKNLVGTYLHGPLLPKNPQLCDMILLNTIKHKYGEVSEFLSLDDEIETLANDYMSHRN